jgi:transcriptional regulator with XRE-family HTH domain
MSLQAGSASLVSRNVRFLLWREGLPPQAWERELSRLLPDLSRRSVRELLSGRAQNELPLREFASAFGLDDEILVFSDLLAESDCSIPTENVRHLLSTLPYGGKKELAVQLNVDPATISRWAASAAVPSNRHSEGLRDYFGLPATLDLSEDPLFLSIDPLSAYSRRAWLHERVDSIGVAELREVYVALHRLLEQR